MFKIEKQNHIMKNSRSQLSNDKDVIQTKKFEEGDIIFLHP